MDYNGTKLHFSYDVNGSPMTVVYNGNTYYYVLNLQGDVVGILNSSGTRVVTYTYDAWGRPLTTTGSMASTLGLYNPLRYRGYVYDRETGLYYLQSRYYNPNWGRFINADSLVSTGQGVLGYNMFAYCLNNPVCRKDIGGATSQVCYSPEDVDFTDDNQNIDGGKMGNSSFGQGNVSSNGASNKIGFSQAPKNAPAGTTYTQVSSDGNNTVISKTVYGDYDMPTCRIDYVGHNHGTIIGAHIHYFYVHVISGTPYLNKGPIVQCEIFD